MKKYCGRHTKRERGSILVLVVVAIIILLLVGMGLLTITYGVRLRAIKFKNQTVAMLAAEAGYEQGIYWMNKQSDILGSLPASGYLGSITFDNSSCNYIVKPNGYMAGKPIFKVISTGLCGAESREINVDVIQAVTGWDMGMCRIPQSPSSTTPVNFASTNTGTETIELPIHINNFKDNPDVRDIAISGNPQIKQSVSMGESQRSVTNGTNKYSSVMGCFEGGISFDQPDVRITDKGAVDSKLARFKASTKSEFVFTPTLTLPVNIPSNPDNPLTSLAATQLEFHVAGGVGMVRITNNCVVGGYQRTNTHDYMLAPTGGNPYMRYPIYAYHYRDNAQPIDDKPIANAYVAQTFAGEQSEPGGQIYVEGNVILGGDGAAFNQLVVKGKVTVVASGNIWIADSVVVDGTHDVDGMPTSDNPNALGLIAGGVVKVIDPGLSSYSLGGENDYPGGLQADTFTSGVKTYTYAPVANQFPGSAVRGDRVLPHDTVIEAAVTCGGGGWGAENVSTRNDGYLGRRQSGDSRTAPNNHNQDNLVLHGTICEVVRGIVGIVTYDGYLKQYYLDSRLLAGVLPGNIWFGGRFIPAPAGWHDYRP